MERMRYCLATVAIALLPLFACAFPPVVTFSRADAARAMEIGCGVASALDVPVHVHRNIPGTLVYCVAEDHREAVLYSESQQCHELSKEVLDMWRDESGEVKAMLIQKTEGRLLMVGEAELRGKRFDVERTGQYFVISQGGFSQLSAIAKPYRVLLTLDLDAQRIFTRKNELLVVGNNFRTNQLEARVVRYIEGSLVQLPPMPIANMPVGVRVHDYSEKTDDLLLGGVDPSGQTMFVVVNLSSGAATAVNPKKPGDDQAMFLSDGNLRAKISGTSSAAAGKRFTGDRTKANWGIKRFLPFLP